MLVLLLLGCPNETGISDASAIGDTDSEIIGSTGDDADHDGSPNDEDCEPYDRTISPLAGEECDEIDNDCDGEVDEGFDVDGDGYWDIRECWQLEGVWDCDDSAATIYPDAPELCNGLDDDCDGEWDEVDADGDGYDFCVDCDDSDGFVFEGAAEACDGIDNDCDGEIDEIWDFDGDGYSACQGDCEDDDPDIGPGAREACDGEDNDCDDLIDEDFDLDGDGQPTCEGDCDDDNAAVYLDAEEICDGYDNDCDPDTDEDGDPDGDGYSICAGDCDESSASAHPGGTESCDSADNDCNGYTDEMPTCWSCTTSGSYYLCDTAASWDDSAQACEGMGGWLVEISDSTENDTVAALGITPTWIGATDAAVEDEWRWIDGSLVSYDSWGTGEPDDSGGADCAQTNTSGRRGTWSDTSCSTTLQFVCEF